VEEMKKQVDERVGQSVEDMKKQVDESVGQGVEHMKKQVDESVGLGVEDMKKRVDESFGQGVEDMKKQVDESVGLGVEDMKKRVDESVVHGVEHMKKQVDETVLHGVEDMKKQAHEEHGKLIREVQIGINPSDMELKLTNPVLIKAEYLFCDYVSVDDDLLADLRCGDVLRRDQQEKCQHHHDCMAKLKLLLTFLDKNLQEKYCTMDELINCLENSYPVISKKLSQAYNELSVDTGDESAKSEDLADSSPDC
jgi:hypothetical protein